MIVAVYARKSTDDSDRNAEARSTQRQIDSATAYARAKGWTVDPRYVFVDENTSGAEWMRRPGFNALLAALDPRPPFGVVIVSELSRIGRDTVRTPAAVMRIEEGGVEIRSYLSDAPISLADETSEIHTIFNSLAASFERRRARQRTCDALRRRAEAGAVTGGTCYGYRNQRDGSGYVQRVIDETEAAVVRRIFETRHYSRRTEKAYIHWIKRYIFFHGKRHPAEMGATEVAAFLTSLAVQGKVAASTQNQALSALLFLYREVLGIDLPWLDEVVRAKRPVHLPVVLTREEVRAVLQRLDGVPRLMAVLLYGAGLRLLECCRLRVKDVDFAMSRLTIRDGEGHKDRATMLPAAVRANLLVRLSVRPPWRN